MSKADHGELGERPKPSSLIVGVPIGWHLEKRRVKDLIHHPRNPRQITRKQFEDLRQSVREFGLIDKPVVTVDSWAIGGTYPANMLLGGHRRVDVYEAEGITEIEVWVPDVPLTDAQADELNIRLNKNTGSWDFDALANGWEAEKLGEWGFESWELAGSLDEPEAQYGAPVGGVPGFVGDDEDGDAEIVPPETAETLPSSHVRMVQLFLMEATYPEYLDLVSRAASIFSTANPTDTVMEALRHACDSSDR